MRVTVKNYKLWALLSILFAGQMQAETYHDYRSIWGELNKVISPNTVKIDFYKDNIKFNLVIKLDALKVPDNANCDEGIGVQLCDFLATSLSGKKVGVVVDGSYDEMLAGDLIVDERSIVLKGLREGYYRMDGRVSRALPNVYAEKEARCSFKGIWSSLKGDPYVAQQCQSI